MFAIPWEGIAERIRPTYGSEAIKWQETISDTVDMSIYKMNGSNKAVNKFTYFSNNSNKLDTYW